jgi:hypothetical protein
MPEDHTNLKDNAKEQVLAAIQTLRAKGAEINPYTVANEGGVPRSTIYRNAELMELISREKAEPSEKLVAKDAGYPDRVAELEAQVEELGQTIWNLEKQNEDLQKDFSDAWTMGFAAGLEEANKRHAKGIKSDAPTPVTESSAWPSVERNAAASVETEPAAAESNALVTPAPTQTDFSGMPGEKDLPPHTAPIITPVTLPVSAAVEASVDAASNETAPVPTTTSESPIIAAASAATVPTASTPTHQSRRALDQAESGTFNAAAAPIKSSQSLSSIIDFSTAAENAAAESTEQSQPAGKEATTPTKGNRGQSSAGADKIIFSDPLEEENEFAYYGDEVVLSQEYLYSEELLKEAESILFGGGDKSQSTNGGTKGAAAADKASSVNIEKIQEAANLSRDSSHAPSQSSPVVVPGAAGLESGLNLGAIAAVTGPLVVESRKSKPAADAFAAKHAYDPTSGIYNVARSGPYVASDFNPLIELSWKDIEDVYNYRASTLKDYARNVPSAPNKLGATVSLEKNSNGADKKPGEFEDAASLVDANILAMLPSDAELSSLQELDTAVYMSEEVADIVPESSFGYTKDQDPDATGDRMQAMVGYKPDVHANRLNPSADERANPSTASQSAANPAAADQSAANPSTAKQPTVKPSAQAFDSEGIVDLDALDIFDNLDEWIDIDRLERGEDPFGKTSDQTSANAAQTIKTDELAELIKKRIEQASEMAAEAPAQARGLGLGKPPTHAGPQPAAEPAEAGGDPSQPRAKSKFLGGKASSAAAPTPTTPYVKVIPPDIRKACLILGVRQEDLTTAAVVEAWKRQIVDVHPDKGGDTETAIILNTAKDSLVHWIEAQAPKLGNKFGKPKDVPPRDKDKDKDKG